MPEVYVLFWFDVEDYLTPESDDALAGCIEALDAHGVRGTFKIVGEKLRVLKERGREDILEGLRRHDVGYHTDLHSVHPTPAEYLEGLGWQDGIEEFERRERAGFEELAGTFGRLPSCYGQPGDSWAPHAYGALRRWGVPLYLDEANHVGLDDKPFRYCGVLNIFRLRGNTTRVPLDRGVKGGEQAAREFDLLRDRLGGGGVISIYYHPCEFATYEFWDAVNFASGRNPPRSQWRSPAAKPRAERDAQLALFRDYVGHIATQAGVRVITAGEAVERFADRAGERLFGESEVRAIAGGLGDAIGYWNDEGCDLSAAESMYLVLSVLTRRSSPAGVRTRAALLGPARRVAGNVEHSRLAPFREACEWALRFMETEGRVPDAVPLPGGSVNPVDLFATANRLLAGRQEESFPIRRGRLVVEEQATGANSWRWVIFPQGFDAPEIVELAKLQTWSLKPARAW